VVMWQDTNILEDLAFWVVMPHSDVVGYQHFRGPCCLHLQGEMSWAWKWTKI